MNATRQKILVTGSAGFIGFHLANRLCNEGFEVIGLDNLNNYYDVKLKLDRLNMAGIDSRKIAYNEPVTSSKSPNYTFIQLGIEDAANLERLFRKNHFDAVCHLAAQAGIRYSIKHPEAYIQSNISGFFNILEKCRHHKIGHLIFASSSSVYGGNKNVPFEESQKTDSPISFYAATKKSNELMAYSYSHLYNMRITGLRFFTVYGPWGRPDMACSLFAEAIINDKPLKVFNKGEMARDFTYISDTVEGICKVLNQDSLQKEHDIAAKKRTPYSVYNLGKGEPIKLIEFINTLEDALNKKAIQELLPIQDGDMVSTYANTELMKKEFSFNPTVALKEGLHLFVDWYKNYYPINN